MSTRLMLGLLGTRHSREERLAQTGSSRTHALLSLGDCGSRQSERRRFIRYANLIPRTGQWPDERRRAIGLRELDPPVAALSADTGPARPLQVDAVERVGGWYGGEAAGTDGERVVPWTDEEGANERRKACRADSHAAVAGTPDRWNPRLDAPRRPRTSQTVEGGGQAATAAGSR